MPVAKGWQGPLSVQSREEAVCRAQGPGEPGAPGNHVTSAPRPAHCLVPVRGGAALGVWSRLGG